MIQTVDSITSQVSVTERTVEELRTQTTVIAQKSDSLELSVTSIRTDLDAKADQKQVDEITEHFRFDENGLTISNSATGMGIGVSEQRVVFTGGDNPTTVIYPNEMHTTNIRVLERLDLGEFSFLPRTNGNLSFRYTGSS